MEQNLSKRFLNIKEVALYLGVSQHTIRAWVRQLNGIPFSRFGRAIRFDLKSIDLWIKTREVKFSPEKLGFPLKKTGIYVSSNPRLSDLSREE